MFGCYKRVLHSQGVASCKTYFKYTHCLLQLDSNTRRNAHLPTDTLQGWLKEPRIHKEFILQAYQRPTANPSCSRGTENKYDKRDDIHCAQLCCNKLARGETIFFFLPIKFPVPVLFPSKTKRRARHAGFHYEWSCTTLWREWENLWGVQEPRQRLPLSFLSWDALRAHWGMDLTCSVFNIEFELVG